MRGYDGPDTAAAQALLARSLLAHGKAREAELWTRRAEAAGDSPDARHARLLLELVSTRLDRDPEIPLAPGEELDPPAVPAYLASTPPGAGRQGEGASTPRCWPDYHARRYVTGYKVMETWPEDLWAGLGKDFALLTGFLDYKAEIYADAIDELKALADDAGLRRPPARGRCTTWGARITRGAVHARPSTRWNAISVRRRCWGGDISAPPRGPVRSTLA